MTEPPRLCPFSFPFHVKQSSPVQIAPNQSAVSIQVGFPCIGNKCQWYDWARAQCVVHAIRDMIAEIKRNERD